jgi:hypothetical protein
LKEVFKTYIYIVVYYNFILGQIPVFWTFKENITRIFLKYFKLYKLKYKTINQDSGDNLQIQQVVSLKQNHGFYANLTLWLS